MAQERGRLQHIPVFANRTKDHKEVAVASYLRVRDRKRRNKSPRLGAAHHTLDLNLKMPLALPVRQGSGSAYALSAIGYNPANHDEVTATIGKLVFGLARARSGARA
jgi:hypothetical protein